MAATKNQNSGDPRGDETVTGMCPWAIAASWEPGGTVGQTAESTELICSVSRGGGSNVALFQRKSVVQSEQGEKKLETVPRWRHIFPPLGLGGKVDVVRAAAQGGRPSSRQRATGRRDGDCTSRLTHRQCRRAEAATGAAVREGRAREGTFRPLKSRMQWPLRDLLGARGWRNREQVGR
jgi:hypothetical protein